MFAPSKGLSPAYVRRVFRAAGFPLRHHAHAIHWYESSVLDVRYCGDSSTIMVYFRRSYRGSTSTSFDSPAKAIAFIRARLSIQVVAGNDWALNTGPRGQLGLIMGGAA